MTKEEQFAFNDIDDVKKALLENGLDLAHDVLHQAENVLKKSAEEHRWIPVTERLPEKGGLYFVTKENDYGKYVATEWFYQNNTWSTGWRVTAWMPLPKPYEEGGEQNDSSI